jgi:two-component system OmpR family sensor kinase
MSLRRNLLFWILTSVLAGGVLASSVAYFRALGETGEILDYQLRQVALTLRDRSFSSASLAEALKDEEALDVVIQVRGPDGALLYDSAPGAGLPGSALLGFDVVEASGVPWRRFAVQQRGLTIQVAHPMALRDRLAASAAFRTLLPFLVALPLMGLLIWRLVGHALAPLERTAEAVARRSPASLDPITTEGAPQELRPLIAALNELLARLGAALGAQRRFVADAAHELRSPLTALSLQLQLATRARSDEKRAAAQEALRQGVERATRLVEQLLALARQSPDAPVEPPRPVDLLLVARAAVSHHAAEAASKSLDLALDGMAAGVQGEPAGLATLADNLVANAVRYTPPGGNIRVRVGRDSRGPYLQVADDGPGIAPPERERVFDRFYRGTDAGAPGSGLGLAIVKEVADRHGAAVSIAEGLGGRGTLVRVDFPAGRASPALSSA